MLKLTLANQKSYKNSPTRAVANSKVAQKVVGSRGREVGRAPYQSGSGHLGINQRLYGFGLAFAFGASGDRS